jgi:hypothetical protein
VKIVSTLSLILALTTMLYMSVGEAGSAYVGISEAKTEAAQKLKTEPLHTIKLHKADFTSGKASFPEENELSYMGSRYDIATTATEGDEITLTVLHDEKEEGLISALQEAVDHWLSESPKNNKQPIAKKISPIKDFLPVAKFTLTSAPSVIALAAQTDCFSTHSPALGVLKSPPQLG